MSKRWVGVLVLVPLLSACATVPTGPSVMVLPGSGKSFEQFQADDTVCRQWAHQQTGTTPGESSSGSGIASAAVGTALGAAAGAAIWPFSLRAGQLWRPEPWLYAIHPLLQGNRPGRMDRTFLSGKARCCTRRRRQGNRHGGGTFSRCKAFSR